MALTRLSGPMAVTGGFTPGLAGSNENTDRTPIAKRVAVAIASGAADVNFTLPAGARILEAYADTTTAVAGTPTTSNLRIGTTANGQEVVADVDVKAAGGINLTVTTAGRSRFSASQSFNVRVASSGGTPGAGQVFLEVLYTVS